jgi:ribonuclease P/MRP protein subunit RPP1
VAAYNKTSTLGVYKRLTIVLSDPAQNYGLNAPSGILKSYDLIAVQPETERTFISACTNLEIDIISLDLSAKLAFPIKAGYLRQAFQRGILFEVTYGDMVADQSARRNAIAGARMLLRLALGRRGLLMSSGTEHIWGLRAPADVLNLAALLGLKNDVKRNCLTASAEAAVLHGGARKYTHKGAICILPEAATFSTGEALEKPDFFMEDFIELK